MKFEYMTDNTEKTLAPWASLDILNKLFWQGTTAALIFLFLFWREKDLPELIRRQETPMFFFWIFGICLVMTAYLNLRCGLGEFTSIKETPWIEYQKNVTYEEERPFATYGLIGFILHTVLLLLPLLPLLIMAAGFSAVEPPIVFRALAMILLFSLVSRLFGFWIYLAWDRKGPAAYFSTRIFFLILFGATVGFKEKGNVFVLLFALNKGETPLIGPGLTAYALQMLSAAVWALAFSGMIQWIIHRRQKTVKEL
ncbi:MAG: hypothetical protein EHM45_00640 [Desulfobacteraceae bacterium]|nr:MAG: hypothetical protein EHM45_00640 [Desulfobacteraceae bacterium]